VFGAALAVYVWRLIKARMSVLPHPLGTSDLWSVAAVLFVLYLPFFYLAFRVWRQFHRDITFRPELKDYTKKGWWALAALILVVPPLIAFTITAELKEHDDLQPRQLSANWG
jgi:hypothetical protein